MASPAASGKPATIVSPNDSARLAHAVMLGPSRVSANEDSSARSAKTYPDDASSGSTTICAPSRAAASTASRAVVRFPGVSPIKSRIWAQATRVVIPRWWSTAARFAAKSMAELVNMRMSAKAEYAVRAMVQLAAADEGTVVKTDDLAKAQGIPPQFLVDILSDLRTDRLVRSRRGREGGYELARPAAEISIADVLRCIDGPLASVRDIGLGDLPYSGPTAALTDVWRALRASMRSVLEETSLADVATGALPSHVATFADEYRGQEKERGHRGRKGGDAV